MTPKGSQSCVRPLQPEEVWRAHGGQSAAWSRLRRGGYEERTLVGWALRAAPAELARLLVHFCLSFYGDEGGKRSGVCSLAHEEAAWRRLKRWFSSWEKGFAEMNDDEPGPSWSQQELADWTGNVPARPSPPRVGSGNDRVKGSGTETPGVAFPYDCLGRDP